MPRIKPTKKIDVIGNLDLSPEHAVGDYIESKQQESYFIKPPNWDSAGDTIELLYIRNEREHKAMQALQADMLKESKQQAAINEVHIRKLCDIQMELRKRFVDVNVFIKDCEDKKHAAQKKVAEETAAHKVINSQINTFRHSINQLEKFRKELQAVVDELEPYELVLQDVVDKSDIFDSVKDCMDRCDALMMAQLEISRLEHKKVHEIEDMRKRMAKTTSEAGLTVLGLKNDLAELERCYHAARSECLKWEGILAQAMHCLAQNDLNKDRVLDGIHNMYLMLCRRRGREATFHRHEVEKQLDYIKNEMEILSEVIIECERIKAEGIIVEDEPAKKK